jgi:solute carrier family 25 protein 39/40
MEKRETQLPLWQSVVAASTGALVTAVVLNPIDVVKVAMQNQNVEAYKNRLSFRESSGSVCPRCGKYPSSWAAMANEPGPVGEAATISPLQAAVRSLGPGGSQVGDLLRKNDVGVQHSDLCAPERLVSARSALEATVRRLQPTVWGTIASIVRVAGVTGLWRGLSASILTIVPATGLYFGLYEQGTQLILRCSPADSRLADPLFVAPFTGAAVRCLVATAVSPLELVRTSMQANGGTIWETLRCTLREGGGVRALWTGLAATLWRDAPFSAIYWGVYESLKVARSRMMNEATTSPVDANSAAKRSILENWEQSAATRSSYHFFSGVTAGMVAAVVTNPADVVKTRNQSWPGVRISAKALTGQTPSHLDTREKPSLVMRFWPAIRQLLREEGVPGLFRGALPRVAKVIPASGIMMVTFEEMKRWLARHEITVHRAVEAKAGSDGMPQAR